MREEKRERDIRKKKDWSWNRTWLSMNLRWSLWEYYNNDIEWKWRYHMSAWWHVNEGKGFRVFGLWAFFSVQRCSKFTETQKVVSSRILKSALLSFKSAQEHLNSHAVKNRESKHSLRCLSVFEQEWEMNWLHTMSARSEHVLAS